MMRSIHCGACGKNLTGALAEAPDSLPLETGNQVDSIPFGLFCVSNGRDLPGTEGKIIANVDLAWRMRKHRDGARSQGCCGPSGDSGPNLVCRCGAEVATLMSACFTPRLLLFEPGAVKIVEGGPRATRGGKPSNNRMQWQEYT